jgi:hypothetical protein
VINEDVEQDRKRISRHGVKLKKVAVKGEKMNKRYESSSTQNTTDDISRGSTYTTRDNENLAKWIAWMRPLGQPELSIAHFDLLTVSFFLLGSIHPCDYIVLGVPS